MPVRCRSWRLAIAPASIEPGCSGRNGASMKLACAAPRIIAPVAGSAALVGGLPAVHHHGSLGLARLDAGYRPIFTCSSQGVRTSVWSASLDRPCPGSLLVFVVTSPYDLLLRRGICGDHHRCGTSFPRDAYALWPSSDEDLRWRPGAPSACAFARAIANKLSEIDSSSR